MVTLPRWLSAPRAAAEPVAPPVAALAVELARRADANRVRGDIAALARTPRNRRQPQSLEEARARVREQLVEAGWSVRAVPFERRWVLGVSDAGPTSSPIRRLRLYPRLNGINLIAERPGPAGASGTPRAPGLLLVAHLDSVAGSPGADDNASGVAALLECARLLASLEPSPTAAPVTLAVVDLEEVGRVGATVLARDPAFRRRVAASVSLESVGTYDDSPGSQRLGALGAVFPGLARRVRANDGRGDFVLALHRRSTRAAAAALARAGAALDPPLVVLGGRDPRPDGVLGWLATGLFPPLGHLDRSDHAPFWHRGVPSMMLTTTAPFRNPRYHRPTDRPDEVDAERVTALAVALAAFAAAGPVTSETGRTPGS
jgi:Peptidase family M28